MNLDALDGERAALLLAGGFGTRMGQVSSHTPKPLQLIGNQTLLSRNLDGLRKAGVTHVYLALHHLAPQIKNYVLRYHERDFNFTFLFEEFPLGTAGALGLIEDSPENLIVQNADLVHEVDIAGLFRRHIESRADATATVVKDFTTLRFGVVKSSKGLITEVEEKPVIAHDVLAGIYILNSTVLKLVHQGRRIDMPDLLNLCVSHKLRVAQFKTESKWLDIATLEDLKSASNDYRTP